MEGEKIEETIVSGDSWRYGWEFMDDEGRLLNLTGISARLQLRNRAGTKVAEATTADGRLTVDVAKSSVFLDMPPAAMTLPPGEYDFALEVVYPDGFKQTYGISALLVTKDGVYDD